MMMAWNRVGAIEVMTSMIIFLSGGLLEVQHKYKRLDKIVQLKLQCPFNCKYI